MTGRSWNTEKIAFGVVLIVLATIAVYLVTRPVPVAQLPAYLDRCLPLTGTFAYDSRPQLAILINGVDETIPDKVGIVGSCVRPIFTLSTSGTLHVKSDVNRTYTLGDFFLVWGNTYGISYSYFNSGQIFTYRTDANHGLTLTVRFHNQTFSDNRFQDFPFPTDANTTSNPMFIIIRYG